MAETGGNGGYIRLHRQILKWEWWSNPNTFRLFIYLLLKANYQQTKYEGKTLERGQLVTTLPQLATDNQQTIQQIRTSLSHLISTGEITVESNTRNRIITVVKYNDYQVDNRQNNRQITDNQQTDQQTNQQLFNKDIINNKKDKNINKSLTRFIPPTVDEVSEYCLSRNNGIDPEEFVNFYESKGWMIGKNRMKSWQAAVRTWERSRKTEVKKPDANPPAGYEQRDYSGEQDEATKRMMEMEW